MDTKSAGMVTRSGRRISMESKDEDSQSTCSTPTKRRGIRRLSTKPDLEDLPEIECTPTPQKSNENANTIQSSPSSAGIRKELPLHTINENAVDSPSRNLRNRSIPVSPAHTKQTDSASPKKVVRKIESALMQYIVDSPKLRKNKRLSTASDTDVSKELTPCRRSRRLSGDLNIVLEDPIREELSEETQPITTSTRRGKRLTIIPTQLPLPEENEDIEESDQSSTSQSLKEEVHAGMSKTLIEKILSPVSVKLEKMQSPKLNTSQRKSPVKNLSFNDSKVEENGFVMDVINTPPKCQPESQNQSLDVSFEREEEIDELHHSDDESTNGRLNRSYSPMDVDISFDNIPNISQKSVTESPIPKDISKATNQVTIEMKNIEKSSVQIGHSESNKNVFVSLEKMQDDLAIVIGSPVHDVLKSQPQSIEEVKSKIDIENENSGDVSFDIIPASQEISVKRGLRSSVRISEGLNKSIEKNVSEVPSVIESPKIHNVCKDSSFHDMSVEEIETCKNEPRTEKLIDISINESIGRTDKSSNEFCADYSNVETTDVNVSVVKEKDVSCILLQSPKKTQSLDTSQKRENLSQEISIVECDVSSPELSSSYNQSSFSTISKNNSCIMSPLRKSLRKSGQGEKEAQSPSKTPSRVTSQSFLKATTLNECEIDRSELNASLNQSTPSNKSRKSISIMSPLRSNDRKSVGKNIEDEIKINLFKNLNSSSKGLNVSSKDLNVSSKSLNSSYKDLNNSSNVLNVSSKNLNVSSKSLNDSSKCLNVSSKSLNVSSKDLNISKNSNNSSKKVNAFSNDVNASSKNINVSPKNFNVSSKGLNDSSKSLNVSSKSLNVSSKSLNVSSKSLNVSSEDLNVSSKDLNISSKDLNNSKNSNNSSKKANVSSNASSKNINVSPKDFNVSSKDLNISSKDFNSPSKDLNIGNLSKKSDDFIRLELLDESASEAGSDYKSGDSLGESEREEMELNEIIEHGESLGSDSSEEDHDSSGYEEDSFVCGSDELFQSTDDERSSELLQSPKKSPKAAAVKSPKTASPALIELVNEKELKSDNKETEGLWVISPIKTGSDESMSRKRKLSDDNKLDKKWTGTAGGFDVVEKDVHARPTCPVSASYFGSTTNFNIVVLKKSPKHSVTVDRQFVSFKENMLYGNNIKRKDSKAIWKMEQKEKASRLYQNF